MTITNSESMLAAFNLIATERARQFGKWGAQADREPAEWVSILGEEFGELAKAVNEWSFAGPGGATLPDNLPTTLDLIGGMRQEAVHVAAVAVAFLEHLDWLEAEMRDEYAGREATG